MRLIPIALLLVSLGVPSSAEGQALGNSEFQIESSPEGLKSLKRTHDEYDTNYIAPGRTLGDIFVRLQNGRGKGMEKGLGSNDRLWGGAKHQTDIQVSGFPVGTYEVRSNKDVRWTLPFREGETKVVRVPVDTVGATVVLTRVSAVPH